MQHSCKNAALCDIAQEIMRHLHAYTTQLALLDMYASLAHVRHRGQTYQLASGMLGARREGPANAPTSQAATTRRCRNSRRAPPPGNEAHAKCKRHMLNASDASFDRGRESAREDREGVREEGRGVREGRERGA